MDTDCDRMDWSRGQRHPIYRTGKSGFRGTDQIKPVKKLPLTSHVKCSKLTFPPPKKKAGQVAVLAMTYYTGSNLVSHSGPRAFCDTRDVPAALQEYINSHMSAHHLLVLAHMTNKVFIRFILQRQSSIFWPIFVSDKSIRVDSMLDFDCRRLRLFRGKYRSSPRGGRPVIDWFWNAFEWCILNGAPPFQGWTLAPVPLAGSASAFRIGGTGGGG